ERSRCLADRAEVLYGDLLRERYRNLPTQGLCSSASPHRVDRVADESGAAVAALLVIASPGFCDHPGPRPFSSQSHRSPVCPSDCPPARDAGDDRADRRFVPDRVQVCSGHSSCAWLLVSTTGATQARVGNPRSDHWRPVAAVCRMMLAENELTLFSASR